MGLGVPEATAVRGEDQRDVVDLVTLRLQGAADDRYVVLLGKVREAVGRDRARTPRHRLGLVQRGVRVPSHGRLGEDGQLHAGVRRLQQEPLDSFQVAVDLTDLGVDLAGCDADAHGTCPLLACRGEKCHPSSHAGGCGPPGFPPGAFILLGVRL